MHNESEKEIADLKVKISEANDKYLRLYSEFDNFRKRTAKERIELIQSAGEDIYKSILPLLDDFERAIKFNSETTDIKAVNEGVQIILNKFKSIIQQNGFEKVATSFMENLNTNVNDTLNEENGKKIDPPYNNDDDDDGTVLDEYKRPKKPIKPLSGAEQIPKS